MLPSLMPLFSLKEDTFMVKLYIFVTYFSGLIISISSNILKHLECTTN